MNRRDQRVGFLTRLMLLVIALSCFLGTASGEQSYVSVEYADQEPTCTEAGYRAIEREGTIFLEEIPATGHIFSEWEEDSEGKTRTHYCLVCGYEETLRISSIPEKSIPHLYLTGSMDGIGKKSKVVLEASYQSDDQNFDCYAIMTLQGHSTFGLPKKNYTIRFYADDKGTAKHKLRFRNWRKEHKYILKANYADLTQCRNLVGCSIWSEMANTRANAPKRLLEMPTHGAVDGFPVAVYLNDSFFGLYTMNLHKDDDLYKLQDGKQEALLICNAQTTDESLFREEAIFANDYSSDWEVEFCGTEDETWAKESFNEFISFVMNSSDTEFREHLADYLDTDGAVDYLLLIYSLGLQHSGSKDLVMLYLDGKWVPSAFDMDEAFGLDISESIYLSSGDFLPTRSEDGGWISGTGSLLWDRLLNNYSDQIIERYRELRMGVLSEDGMVKLVHGFISQVPESYYDRDLYLYPDRPIMDMNMETQIESFIRDRMPMLDTALEGNAQ